jgi:hypothetical protein
MRYVKTHRLKRESAELPFDLTLEHLIGYIALFFPLSHIAFLVTGNKLLSWVGGAAMIVVLHQSTKTISDLIPFHKAASYWRFLFSADRYVIKNEITSLPHIIDIEQKEVSHDEFTLATST